MENFSVISIITEPEKLLMGIYREAVAEPYSDGGIKGWRFYVEKINDFGRNEPVWDTWEEQFSGILEYPALYTRVPVVWRDSNDGNVIDMNKVLKIVSLL
ncbi:hypothetical protein [Asticcacaulis sp.]|uniref:hypothetical protein n=1 Tax=Asticcacaulis sp. TaxID=1872648 RepID=UPI003F7BEE28